MNVGLFGGTFDPVHRGHLALARVALAQYKLNRIYFVPANVPPHKQRQPLTPFVHRFAMLALATAAEKAFVPSLLEAAEEAVPNRKPGQEKPNYTIDTIRRLKRDFKLRDKLFFLIGMDAFADIANWHEAEALFRECEFVVANRPGYSLADVANALPASLRPRPEVTKAVSANTSRHGRSGVEGCDYSFARRPASTGVGYCDSTGCGVGQGFGAVCRHAGSGVHQEDGVV